MHPEQVGRELFRLVFGSVFAIYGWLGFSHFFPFVLPPFFYEVPHSYHAIGLCFFFLYFICFFSEVIIEVLTGLFL